MDGNDEQPQQQPEAATAPAPQEPAKAPEPPAEQPKPWHYKIVAICPSGGKHGRMKEWHYNPNDPGVEEQYNMLQRQHRFQAVYVVREDGAVPVREKPLPPANTPTQLTMPPNCPSCGQATAECCLEDVPFVKGSDGRLHRVKPGDKGRIIYKRMCPNCIRGLGA